MNTSFITGLRLRFRPRVCGTPSHTNCPFRITQSAEKLRDRGQAAVRPSARETLFLVGRGFATAVALALDGQDVGWWTRRSISAVAQVALSLVQLAEREEGPVAQTRQAPVLGEGMQNGEAQSKTTH